MEPWRLKRTQQCAKCPWRKDVNPLDIPNGYDVEKHKALDCTISKSPLDSLGGKMYMMACHENHDAHCLGWLMNQVGPGNNLGVRLMVSKCENMRDVRLVGEQHERFEDTIPGGA